MAKSKQSGLSDEEMSLIEGQVAIIPRGRSVVNATVLVGSEVRTAKHELSEAEKLAFGKLILEALAVNLVQGR